jgi:hypothetical protein
MYETIVSTEDRLRLLNERLDESVAQCIELSVGAYQPDGFDRVEGTLGHINDELEVLRGAVAETRSWTDAPSMPDPSPTRTDEPGRSSGPGQPGTA